jgi:peptide deformylase
MFIHTLKEHALEEGGLQRATMRAFVHAGAEWSRYSTPSSRRRAWFHVAVLAWLSVCASARKQPKTAPPASVPPPKPVDPASLAAIYGRLRATAGAPNMPDDDPYIVQLVARIRATMDAYNYTCLCASHVGVPVQIAVVGNATDGVVLVNPRRGQTGVKVSSALETSAFYPKRTPTRVTRFVPATVFTRDREGPHVFAGRTTAHCVLHLTDQLLDGRSPYDT